MTACGACGRPLSPGDRFCPGCGRPTTPVSTGGGAPPVSGAGDRVGDVPLFESDDQCPSCGLTLLDGRCPDCESQSAPPPAARPWVAVLGLIVAALLSFTAAYSWSRFREPRPGPVASPTPEVVPVPGEDDPSPVEEIEGGLGSATPDEVTPVGASPPSPARDETGASAIPEPTGTSASATGPGSDEGGADVAGREGTPSGADPPGSGSDGSNDPGGVEPAFLREISSADPPSTQTRQEAPPASAAHTSRTGSPPPTAPPPPPVASGFPTLPRTARSEGAEAPTAVENVSTAPGVSSEPSGPAEDGTATALPPSDSGQDAPADALTADVDRLEARSRLAADRGRVLELCTTAERLRSIRPSHPRVAEWTEDCDGARERIRAARRDVLDDLFEKWIASLESERLEACLNLFDDGARGPTRAALSRHFERWEGTLLAVEILMLRADDDGADFRARLRFVAEPEGGGDHQLAGESVWNGRIEGREFVLPWEAVP